jgi:phenylpropionate dioxygenase-like ring-hydroxylating dioxygenase large terminal subunit
MDLDDVLRGLADHAKGPPRALPAACYTHPDFFEAELEHVLRPGWHAVARADELGSSGDYRSLDLLGEPLLLVRDESGRLRVYSRICRHRAFPIVEGSGNARRFVCPYHRWAYGLDGRLRAAPYMDEVEGFERGSCRLPELPLEEWQGFVLVSLDPAASPLSPRIHQLDALLAPFDFAGLRLAATLEYDSPWNWKVMVENFMESYHHMGPHVDNLQTANPAQGTHAVDLPGDFLLLENPPAPGADPFWVAQVFPTLLFFLQRGETPIGSWFELQIDSAEHFHLRIHLLVPPALAADEAAVEGLRKIVEEIHGQDIAMCEGVQRGLRSRLWQPSRLARQEDTLVGFHRFLAERMAGAALAQR